MPERKAALDSDSPLPSSILRGRHKITISVSAFPLGINGVVPLAVKAVASEVDFSCLLPGYFKSSRILLGVELCSDFEPSLGRCSGDQIDNHPMTDEGLASLILADKGEQAMFDLVPLTCARR